jgi:transcriptional regulator NrdR family protein
MTENKQCCTMESCRVIDSMITSKKIRLCVRECKVCGTRYQSTELLNLQSANAPTFNRRKK